MLSGDTVTIIITALAALLGSGGVTALYHEITLRRKVNSDADRQHQEVETDLMKYFAEEIKRLNKTTTEQLNKIQEENEGLKKQISTLNAKIAELTNWIMSDNANYRNWLEKSLRDLDPTIVFPPCTQPPKAWDTNTDDSRDNESHEEAPTEETTTDET